MADEPDGDARRPLLLALAVVAVIGWALAGWLWLQASQTQSQMTEALHAAEQAREQLATDLQNLQKTAGTVGRSQGPGGRGAENAVRGGLRARLRAERTRRPHQADQRRPARRFPARRRRSAPRPATCRRSTPGSRTRPPRFRRCRRRSRRCPARRRGCRRRSTPRTPPLPTPRTRRPPPRSSSKPCRGRSTPRRPSSTPSRSRSARRKSAAPAALSVAPLGDFRQPYGMDCARRRPCYNPQRGAPGTGKSRLRWGSGPRGLHGRSDRHQPAENAGAAPHVGRTQGRGSRQADLFGRQDPGGRQPARLVPRRRLRHARPHRRPLVRLDRRRLRRQAQARLLSLARIPDRPAAVRRADQSRRRRADGRGADGARRQPRPSCARSSRTRRSATAASAGSPPASWTAWRRCGIAAHGYGIRYDHGLFRQIIRDGWQQETPEDWLANGNPWEFERPEVQLRDRLRRLGRDGARRRRRAPRHIWHPAETRRGGRLRHADRRLARPARQHAAPVVGARARSVQARRLQRRRLCRRALATRCAPRRSRKVLYPSDATPAGQELRLRQEYFFTSASLQDLIRRHVQAARRRPHARRPRRDPAQRHPSGDRGRRADAHSDRRATASTGTRPGRSRRRRSPTPTTRCCRRRWRAGRCR